MQHAAPRANGATKMPDGFAVVAKYDHPMLIQRLMKEEGLSEADAQRHFLAVKQFLFIATLTEFNCSPSKVLDIGWHHFILFTRDYAAFCENYLGGFIHHNPTGKPEVEGYRRTYQAAVEHFGDLDAELWPDPANFANAALCGEGDCNGNCSSGACSQCHEG